MRNNTSKLYYTNPENITKLIKNITKDDYKIIENITLDNVMTNFDMIYGDMSDYDILDKAIAQIEHIVILGGLVGDPITKKYPLLSNKVNCVGLQKCIDFFDNTNISKLVFISTCSNYGLIGENQLADEEFELNPLSLYAKAKVAAENHLMSKKGTVRYSATILRFATAFGLSPRMRFDLSLSEFLRDLYFGSELVVYDEHTWRPYCHVRDFARLIDIVLSAETDKIDFQIFNAGGDKNNFTKKMIIDNIVKYLITLFFKILKIIFIYF
jgi:nucleoside-diphosphate-sugar epimerase